MATFYLVRHAHSDWSTDENRPLSARGSEDAGRVADILQTRPISVIYSSPYKRASQTIDPLADRLDLPVFVEPKLRERRLGKINGLDFFKAVEATWDDPQFTHPEGESNTAAQQRGLAVVKRLQKQHVAEHIVLSTHGNLMALIIQDFIPSVGYRFWRSLSMPDIYILNFSHGGEVVLDRLWQDIECG